MYVYVHKYGCGWAQTSLDTIDLPGQRIRLRHFAWEMVHFIFKNARKIRDEAHVARMTSLAFGCALRVLVCGF